MSLSTRRPATRRNRGLETVGILVKRPSESDLESVRSGIRTVVAAGLRCGECDGEWDDVFPPAGHKHSVCPHCGALNRIFGDWTAS